MSCYLCLLPVVEPAAMYGVPTVGATPFMLEKGTPALCMECRIELGRSWSQDRARAPLAESGPAAQRAAS